MSYDTERIHGTIGDINLDYLEGEWFQLFPDHKETEQTIICEYDLETGKKFREE